MITSDELRAHLHGTFGEDPGLEPTTLHGIPVLLERRYRTWQATVLGQPMVFAMVPRKNATTHPGRLVRDAHRLQQAAAPLPVALVVPRGRAHVLRRLLRERIPFVVPDRQTFLPSLGAILSKRAMGSPTDAGGRLEWPGQLTLLRHILHGDVEDVSLRQLARHLGYSAMTMTNVQRQLVELDLAELGRRGRARVLRFTGARRALWERASDHLASPCRRREHARIAVSPAQWMRAGASALALRTDLADDDLPTLAIPARQARDERRAGRLATCEDPDDATAVVETWAYDPRVLSNDAAVDPLSLYLTIAPAQDARLDAAAQQLLESVSW